MKTKPILTAKPLLGAIIKRSIKIRNTVDFRQLRPNRMQLRTFKKLLETGKNTAFGRHYDFQELLMSDNPVEEYQASVPIFDYNKMYDEWWHRLLDNEEDVTWEGKVRNFALSSGTSGAPSKYIPVTDDMQKAMRKAALKTFFCLTKFNLDSDIFTKEMLMIGGTSDLQNKGGYFVGDLSGINSKEPPFWLRSSFRPGPEIARISEWNDRIEVIAELAPTWDVGFLSGIPSWIQLTLEKIIEKHKLKNIHELWPNLSVFVHGGIAFEPYQKSFERLLAHPLVYMDSYLASEGFIAFQNRPETRSMALLLNNGIFFEFVPFNEENFDEDSNIKPAAAALTIEEVTSGVDYALLLSTCSGAWRYLIGDTVRFTDVPRCEIIITGRTKHFLSICGEHLSVDNMNHAVSHAQEVLNVNINEFTVCGITAGNHHRHSWYIDCEPAVDAELLMKTIDDELKIINDDYAIERKSALAEPILKIVPTEMFYDWLRKGGKSLGQSKFPRVMKKDIFYEWENFLNEKNVTQS